MSAEAANYAGSKSASSAICERIPAVRIKHSGDAIATEPRSLAQHMSQDAQELNKTNGSVSS